RLAGKRAGLGRGGRGRGAHPAATPGRRGGRRAGRRAAAHPRAERPKTKDEGRRFERGGSSFVFGLSSFVGGLCSRPISWLRGSTRRRRFAARPGADPRALPVCF